MFDNDSPDINGAVKVNVSGGNALSLLDTANSPVRSQPPLLNPTFWDDHMAINAAPRFSPGWAVLGEHGDKILEPAPKEIKDHGAPIRGPPAWKLAYKIGRGTFGAVFLERVQMSGKEFPELWAVKRIPRDLQNFPTKQYRAEIKNSQALSNYEWFVKFYSSYEDTNYVYIAMEYIPLGDMSKTFVNGYRWDESDTKVVIEQLLHGLAVMHKEGIAHRDLKPENIFLCFTENETHVLRVKIGDFGTSKHIPLSGASTYLKTTTGTVGYMAPEVQDTSKPKTNSVDIWSLGCILYRMVAGKPLFKDLLEVLMYSITASSPPPAVEKIGFSVPCVSFLRDILQPSPGDRPGAEACLKKAWIVSKDPGSEYSIGRDLYSKLSKMKLAVRHLEPPPDAAVNLAAGVYGAQTEPMAPSPTQSGNLGVNNFPENSPFFPEGAIFGEPRRGTPLPAPREVDFHGAPVREPPAWKLNYKIGSGSFGTVFLEKVQTRGMESPELWAVKRISRIVPSFAGQYENEIRNLHALSGHEWFVKFYSAYEDDHCVHIAMEYIPIGDMSKAFVNGYRWSESDTKVVIEQLLHGLVVMHKEGIAHCDLKPENILLCLSGDQAFVLRVKIGGFDTSKRIPPSNTPTGLVKTSGTPGYMAPELDDTAVLKTNKIDIWSLGCILYRMVAGSLPFSGRRQVFVYADTGSSPPQVVKGGDFSVACKDFLRGVLQPNPENRPSAEGCLMEPWIANKASGSEYAIGLDLYRRLVKIERSAPDIDTFSDMVAHRANNTLARSFTAWATSVSSSMAGALGTSKTSYTD